jgi:hypothetical protein
MVTAAAGMIAPVVSVTWPLMDPVVDWGEARGGATSTGTANRRAKKMLMNLIGRAFPQVRSRNGETFTWKPGT